MPNETPMMRQYRELKSQYPETLLLLRFGDFYEAFFDDAVEVAKVCGLTLTTRDKGDNAVPMTGFPYMALEGNIRKLTAAGRGVAVAEQVEKAAKGRKVERLVVG